MTIQRWGGLASFLLAPALVVPQWIYLTGNLRAAGGPQAYALADFLAGPACAACMVVALVALRERLAEHAPRRMGLALLIGTLGAALLVAAALFRSANRSSLSADPALPDALAATLLTAWGTIVAGVIATGWHGLGWALLLAGWAGWASRRLPRALSGLYLAAGALALFGYLLPELEPGAALLGLVVSLWQGVVLWSTGPGATPAPRPAVGQPEHG